MLRCFTPSRRASVAAAFALLLLSSASARALTIKSATVTRHPVKGDTFAIKGELEPFDTLPLATASGLVFELEGTIVGLRADGFKRSKSRLAYKAPRGAPGVAQLVIDLKKRRFAAKGRGVALPALPGAFTARLVADDVAACARVPLSRLGKPPTKPPTKPKAIKYGLPRGGASGPCLLAGRPRADPSAIVVDTPTSVAFSAVLTAGLVLDGDGARVRTLDADGAPIGAPLCTLADDGGPASGDLVAGDGLFVCSATLTPVTLGAVTVTIEATTGGIALRSPPLAVPVVAPLTDADLTAMFDAQAQAGAVWDTIEPTLGDTLNARLEAVRQIALLPSVAAAGLSPDGVDITIRFTSGHDGGVLLGTRQGDVSAVALQPAPAAAHDAPAANDAGRADGGPRNLTRCPALKERTLIGDREALLLTTQYFGPNDDAPIARKAFEDSCLPIKLKVKERQLTVANLLDLAPFSSVFISTHGYVDAAGRILIVTDQTATRADVVANGPLLDPFAKREIFLVMIPAKKRGGGRIVWVVRPSYLRRIQGPLDHGLVYASHCHSASDPAESAAFLSKGARTFFGYHRVASNEFAHRVTSTLLPDLAQSLLTTGDAFARALKVDPKPMFADDLGKGLAPVRGDPATFHIIGDANLAYVGLPTITPQSSTIALGETVDLTVDVPQKHDCELVHRWSTTTFVGRLEDDQGHQGATFDSTAEKVTYKTVEDTPDTDDIDVAVRAPDKKDGSEPPFFGATCAVVEVAGCGDGVVQGSEECDGQAGPACPGACLLDCTCRKDPVCGNGVKEPGEICDGNDKAICDAAHPTGNGYCRPNCGGCAVCGDGIVTPNEECDPLDDSPCPNACRINCTCGCAPGDPNGCPSTQCCNPATKDCCAPVRTDGDPACHLVAAGCCGPGEVGLSFCNLPDQICPASNDCSTGTFYYCTFCDGKLIDGFCNTSGCD